MENGKTLKENEENQKILIGLTLEVANQEGFQIESLAADYDPYFIEPDETTGDRCVDGRKVLETTVDGQPTDYTNDGYKGVQIAGGTLGVVSITRNITGIDEEVTRKIVVETYTDNDIKMGGHTDDKHGEIKTKEELDERDGGCGNQGLAADGKLLLYSGLDLDKSVVSSRYEWLRANGAVIPLSGHHHEKYAVVNVITSTTFATSAAADEDHPMFNLDAWALWERAGLIFDKLKESEMEVKGPKQRIKFQEEFTKIGIRDYLQTLAGLGFEKRIHTHSQI